MEPARATLIAIFSFLPLYSPLRRWPIVKPLFVAGLSLLLSWVLALTHADAAVRRFHAACETIDRDPYDTRFYRAFDRFWP